MPASPSPDPAALPLDEVQRICVFRALQLGDMVCAGPALRALRQRFPAAHITLVGLPWAADFARRMAPAVDEHVSFPGWPGLPEQAPDDQRLPAFLREMRERRFDLALQLHGSGRFTNAVVRSFGAACVVGHRPVDMRADESGPGHYWPYPQTLHEVHRNLHLVGKLGAPTDDDRVTFPLHMSDREALAQRRPDLAALPPSGYVCLHPGARDPAKWWPARCFAKVGDALAAQGWQVVITGSGAERELASEVASLMHAPAVHAACDISIGALAVLLSGARLLVCNDTGVAHVAAGLGLPSVVVFKATDPRRWAPLDRSRHIVLHDGEQVPPGVAVGAALELLARQRNRPVADGLQAAAAPAVPPVEVHRA